MNPPHTYYTPTTCRTRKDSNVGVFSCSASFHHPYNTRRGRNDTLIGVFSCSALFLCNTIHAEHEKTPTRVSFCVRRCSAIQYTPSTKDILIGVILCSVSFVCP